MPPWAAIECARRGESWKVKHFTLYPSCASDAAADAPARPVPTTITSNLRLLFGFTSFMSNLWRCQRVSIGPVGSLESSTISLMGCSCDLRALRADDPGQHGDGEGDVDARDDDGEDRGEPLARPVVA